MRTARHHHKLGFTVVELLVTIAIIGILIALLIPAVQAVRESSRKTECQNHLHNIGIGLASYMATHKGLPPGYAPWKINKKTGGFRPGEPAYCWATMLLPYVEQKPLYDQLDVNNIRLGETAVDPDRKQLLQSPLAIYRCPSDIADDTMDSAPIADPLKILDRTDAVPVPGAVAGGTSSYVANCGYWGTYHPAFMIPGTELMNVDEQTGPNNGLFFNASHVADNDIPDGLSQTIAIGERGWFQGSATWVGTANLRGRAAGGSAACLSRVFWRINAIPDPPGIMLRPGMDRKIRGESNARSAFGSYHAGGANFVFADGHAMFIAESIDFRNTTEAELVDVTPVVPEVELLGVFQKLGIRNDEQPTGTY